MNTYVKRTGICLFIYLLIVVGFSAAPKDEAQVAQKESYSPPANTHECEMGDEADCKQQCELGNAESCLNLGLMYVNANGVEQNKPRGAELYRKSCELNSADGCYALYSALLYGVGVPTDSTQALKVAEKACSLGDQKSCSIMSLNRHFANY